MVGHAFTMIHNVHQSADFLPSCRTSDPRMRKDQTSMTSARLTEGRIPNTVPKGNQNIASYHPSGSVSLLESVKRNVQATVRPIPFHNPFFPLIGIRIAVVHSMNTSFLRPFRGCFLHVLCLVLAIQIRTSSSLISSSPSNLVLVRKQDSDSFHDGSFSRIMNGNDGRPSSQCSNTNKASLSSFLYSVTRGGSSEAGGNTYNTGALTRAKSWSQQRNSKSPKRPLMSKDSQTLGLGHIVNKYHVQNNSSINLCPPGMRRSKSQDRIYNEVDTVGRWTTEHVLNHQKPITCLPAVAGGSRPMEGNFTDEMC